jgi:hypothetical protein
MEQQKTLMIDIDCLIRQDLHHVFHVQVTNIYYH